jgi:glutathione S-transferase
MADPVTVWTLDWVPNEPRGFVRDLRLRWACEEAGIPYVVRTVAFDDRATNHLDMQPFGQVPMLEDGSLRMFESGACVLHLARKSEVLMPRDPAGEADVTQWVFAAVNSIEMVTMPWLVLKWHGQESAATTDWMDKRLDQLEAVLATREWLARDRFTAADLMMADALRAPELRARGNRPASEAYVARITARPAFVKAHTDQLALYAAADIKRGVTENA